MGTLEKFKRRLLVDLKREIGQRMCSTDMKYVLSSQPSDAYTFLQAANDAKFNINQHIMERVPQWPDGMDVDAVDALRNAIMQNLKTTPYEYIAPHQPMYPA